MRIWRITGLPAILIIGFLLVSGCTTSAPSAQPVQTTNPPSIPNPGIPNPGIPNLTGAWNVDAHGGFIQKSEVTGKWTHYRNQSSSISARAVITDQEDRVLYGKFLAPIGEGESFIAVIGMDNKTFYYADINGTIEGQIVNNDLINVVYCQDTANGAVMGAGTWTRVK